MATTWDNHANFAFSTVTGPPGSAGTELEINPVDTGAFATPPFNLVCFPPLVQPSLTNAEVVRVTEVDGIIFTIVRAQEGTSAKNILPGWQVMAGPTVKTTTDLQAAINALENGEVSLTKQSVIATGVQATDIGGEVAGAAAAAQSAAESAATSAITGLGLQSASQHPASDFATPSQVTTAQTAAVASAKTAGDSAYVHQDGTGLPALVVTATGVVGHPTTGTWALDQAVVDANGDVWVCTVAGTPGTWVEGATGGGGSVTITSPGGTIGVGGTSGAPQLDVTSLVVSAAKFSATTGNVKTFGPAGTSALDGSYALLAGGTQKVGDNSSTPLSSVYSTLSAAQARYSFATALAQTVDFCAIQLAINTVNAAGGGRVYLPAGNYTSNAQIAPASGVSIFGDGPTSVILGQGEIDVFHWNGSSSNFLTDVVFRDFKIDGSGITSVGSYNVSRKGLSCPFARRVVCDSVQVVNCAATGIAFDQPDQVAVVNCFLEGNGRLWTTGHPGGAGIGIGTQGSTTARPVDQSMIVANNHCVANGSFGIFFEDQNTNDTFGNYGIRIIGNYCEGQHLGGIGVAGGAGVLVAGNTCTDNGNVSDAGAATGNIVVSGGTINNSYPQDVVIEGNTCSYAVESGIVVKYAGSVVLAGRIAIHNNHISFNGTGSTNKGRGISVPTGASNSPGALSIAHNRIFFNKGPGMVFESGLALTGLWVESNKVWSNGTGGGGGSNVVGIYISDNVNDLQLLNNRCFDLASITTPGTGTQTTGLAFGNVTVTGGQIRGNDFRNNKTAAVNLSLSGTPATLTSVVVRNNPGMNPAGVQTVTVPASGTATTASPYDQTFYITANASGTTSVVISAGPTVTIPAGTLATVRVPALQTLTPTYTNAPTWVVEGE